MDAIKENFLKIQEQAKKDSVFAEMLLSGSENLRLSFTDRKLREFSSSMNQTVGLRVVKGSTQGYAWTENLSSDALLRTYRDALANAASMPQTGEAIPVPTEVKAGPDMKELYNPEAVEIEKKMEKARELESAALDQDPRVSAVPYGGFSEVTHWRRILNTQGLDREFKQNYFSGMSYVLAKQDGVSKMDGKGSLVRKFDQLNAREVASKAASKALKLLGAKKLTTGIYPVVIDREVAKSMIGMLGFYFSAKSVFEKKSLLAGKLGQTLVSEKFSLIDDPLNTSVSAARPFDAEGNPSQRTALIENGVIKNFLTNLEYSKKMNLPLTSSAARSPATEMDIGTSNLIVSKGTMSLQEMLSRYPKVIHLTTATGMHSGFKATTGDFSLPGEAFLYENGQNMGPVDQFVFSGNIFEMLKNLEDLGSEYCDLDGYSSVLAPDLLIKELSFAGA